MTATIATTIAEKTLSDVIFCIIHITSFVKLSIKQQCEEIIMIVLRKGKINHFRAFF